MPPISTNTAPHGRFFLVHLNDLHDLKSTLQSKGIELGSECRIYDVPTLSQALQLTALTSDLSNTKDLFEHHARAAKIA